MVTQAEAAQAPARSIDWGKALVAGLIATVVITVTMALFGQNIMKMMGGMIAPGAGTGTQYLLGGAMHLAVGLFYGFVYAWLLGPVRSHGKVVKGLFYAAALTGIALAVMPVMGAMMGGGGAGGPCNPCGPAAQTANPCNPRGPMDDEAANPCNPCGPMDEGAANPCNPCGPGETAGTQNPCNPCGPRHGAQGANPCNPCGASNPCNPCGGSGGPWSGLVSLLNHVFYGLALALIYER